MKVWYPGDAIPESERDRPTIHPDAGEIKPGENDVDAAVGKRLIESRFVKAVEGPRSSRPSTVPPQSRRASEEKGDGDR